MRPKHLDEAFATVAAAQYGVLSREQAMAVGATRQIIESRLRTGRWSRVHPGVYAIAGYPPTWARSLMAATLSCGPTAVVSHTAAATLFQLRGFRDRAVEVTVAVRAGRRDFAVHRARLLEPADVTTVRGIPVTTPARTLIDLAVREPADRLAVALDDALVRRLVTVPRLQWRIDALAGPGRKGVATIRELVAARAGQGPVPESALETKMLAAIHRHGLPRPVLQHPVRIGGKRYRLDFAFLDQKVVIETVGFAVHGGRSAWEKDLARHNDLVRAGWRIVYITWWDLTEREAETMRKIHALLGPAFADSSTSGSGFRRIR